MGRRGWIVLASLGALALIVFFIGVSASNGEKRLRNAITAKQKDNTSEFDNMWKTLQQTAQIPDRERDKLKELFVEYAQARTGNDEGQAKMMKWVTEAVPQNVDAGLYKQLMNTIVASRRSWTDRQKEILDMKREHDNALDLFPSSLFVGGRPRIEVQIVTSARTGAAFDSGQDNDVDLFPKGK